MNLLHRRHAHRAKPLGPNTGTSTMTPTPDALPVSPARAELFPTAVRYTGASLTFNLAGILGASLAPYLATYLAAHYGLAYVGYYLAGVGLVTLVALLLIEDR
jgi:MFS family permease